MAKPEIPRGYALVRLTDLAALLAERTPPDPGPQPEDAWAGLAVAVAMVTAALGRHDIDLEQLADGADPAGIIRVLVPLAAAGLRNCLTGDGVEKFLRDLGEIAAMRGRGPDGRQL